jgi:hypothetical protein
VPAFLLVEVIPLGHSSLVIVAEFHAGVPVLVDYRLVVLTEVFLLGFVAMIVIGFDNLGVKVFG